MYLPDVDTDDDTDDRVVDNTDDNIDIGDMADGEEGTFSCPSRYRIIITYLFQSLFPMEH